MKKSFGLVVCFVFIFCSNVLAQDAKKLIESYVSAPRPKGTDQPEPFRSDLIKLGPAAVEPLIHALTSKETSFKAKQSGIIWILGEIGDARAYEPLKKVLTETEGIEKRRILISLGASLNLKNSSDYVETVFEVLKEDAEPFLKKISRMEVSGKAEWISLFKDQKTIEQVIDRCRDMSHPILG